MAIPELERFREKYPQYNDLDDEELAQRLADKYPAYADFPKRVRASGFGLEKAETISAARTGVAPRDIFPSVSEALRSGQATRFAGVPIPLGGSAVLDVLRIPGRVSAGLARTAEAVGTGVPLRPFERIAGAFRGAAEREPTREREVFETAGADVAFQIAPVAAGAVAASEAARVAGRLLPRAPGIRRLGQLKLARPSTLSRPNVARETRLNEIRTQILKTPRLAGKEFDTQLSQLEQTNPQQLVDLSGVSQTLQDATSRNPAFANLWNRAVKNSKASAKVQSIINQPEVASSVTIRDAQEVKRVLSQALKTKFQQVSPELFDAHLDALDAWHGIRQAQVQAFPQFNDVAQAYHKTLSAFRTVKPYLKESRLEPGILKNFEGNTEILKALREIVTPETIRLIEGLQKAVGTGNLIRRLGLATGIGVAGAVGAGTVGRTLVKMLSGRE